MSVLNRSPCLGEEGKTDPRSAGPPNADARCQKNAADAEVETGGKPAHGRQWVGNDEHRGRRHDGEPPREFHRRGCGRNQTSSMGKAERTPRQPARRRCPRPWERRKQGRREAQAVEGQMTRIMVDGSDSSERAPAMKVPRTFATRRPRRITKAYWFPRRDPAQKRPNAGVKKMVSQDVCRYLLARIHAPGIGLWTQPGNRFSARAGREEGRGAQHKAG